MARAEEPRASINLPIEGWTVVAQDRGFLKEEHGKPGTQANFVDPGRQQPVGAEAAIRYLDRTAHILAGNRAEGERHRRGSGVV